MRKTTIDLRTFCKVVPLIGSPVEAERHTACDTAARMCETHGMRFIDAITQAYGSNDDTKRELEEKQAMIDKLEEDKVVLCDGMQAADEKIKSLSEMHERNGHGLAGFIEDIWRTRQVRLFLIFAVLAGRMWLFAGYEATGAWPLWLTQALNWTVLAAMVTLTAFWISRQYPRSGMTALMMNTIAVGTGCLLATMLFSGGMDFSSWFIPGSAHPLTSSIVLAATFLLTLSNVSEFVADVFAKSDLKPFQELRSWFL